MPELSRLTDLEVLALTMIGEGRGEPVEGQIAIGSIIRNRALTQKIDISQVCFAPKQFSCWNENDPNFAVLEELASRLLLGQSLIEPHEKQCLFLARGIISNEILDNTNGSLNYITIDLFNSPDRPKWVNNLILAKTIGHHVFFKVKNDDKSTLKA